MTEWNQKCNMDKNLQQETKWDVQTHGCRAGDFMCDWMMSLIYKTILLWTQNTWDLQEWRERWNEKEQRSEM